MNLMAVTQTQIRKQKIEGIEQERLGKIPLYHAHYTSSRKKKQWHQIRLLLPFLSFSRWLYERCFWKPKFARRMSKAPILIIKLNSNSYLKQMRKHSRQIFSGEQISIKMSFFLVSLLLRNKLPSSEWDSRNSSSTELASSTELPLLAKKKK